MKLRRLTFGATTLLCAACGGADPAPTELGSMTQAIRAGEGVGGGVYLGADLLVTETQGEAVPCGVGQVEFSVEVSRNGVDGPYQLIDDAKVYRACSAPNQGQLALVLDNSQSLDNEIDIIKDAALRVSDTVIKRGGQVSLTRVSTNASVLSPLSRDTEEVRTAIDGMFVTNGWTSLYDGVRLGNETLGAANNEAATVESFDDAGTFCNVGASRGIVVFTDSQENNSSHQSHWSDEYPGDGIDTSLDDLKQLNVGATHDADLHRRPRRAGGPRGAEQPGRGHRRPPRRARQPGRHPRRAQDAGGVYESDPPRLHAAARPRVRFARRAHLALAHEHLGQLTQGSTVRHLDLPCPARASGRVATILLTLDASDLPKETINRLVAQTVNWASPVDAPRVLFVRDDFHHDEFAHDTGKLYDTLVASGYAASMLDEPADGIRLEDLEGYDVVWFSNPGYPMDDIASFHALLQFSEAGGGVVLQGDDMSWAHGQAFSPERLTQLEHIDNGTSYCGKNIDNGKGEYDVSLVASEHPIVAGLEGPELQVHRRHRHGAPARAV